MLKKINIVVPLIAWRYLYRSAYQKNISIMTRISFISIAIGAFSLTLVTAVTNGFETKIHEKIQGIHAPIMIQAYGQQPLNVEALTSVIQNEFPEVAAISPTSLGHAIIQPEINDNSPIIAIIKAINPVQQAALTTLENKIITPCHTPLSQLIHNDHVVIGSALAHDLGINLNDTIEILHTDPEKIRAKKISLNATHATVAGIIKTGIDEFDSSLIICSFDFFNATFPHIGVTQLNIKLHPDAVWREKEIITKLKERLQLDVYTWKDLYPALMAALILEKYVMFFILTLITIVASMGIASLLFMQISQKAADIAILRAMGATRTTITSIFILFGMIITTSACSLGILLAVLASYLLERFPFIQLPDSYLVSHLPAVMQWHLVIAVFLVIIIISLIAVWIPSRQSKAITIANILRFER